MYRRDSTANEVVEVERVKRKKMRTTIKRVKREIIPSITLTLESLKSFCLHDFNIDVSISTINRAISDFCYSFKKIILILEARNRPDNLQVRYEYYDYYLRQNEDKVIFLDEF